MSIKSDLYEFRMYLFDHSEPEDFILFVKFFQMIIAATKTIETEANIQCFCTLVCGEALRHFNLVSADAKNTETLSDMDYLLKGLVRFPPRKSTFKTKACNF